MQRKEDAQGVGKDLQGALMAILRHLTGEAEPDRDSNEVPPDRSP
jgi:hypothetical protein